MTRNISGLTAANHATQITRITYTVRSFSVKQVYPLGLSLRKRESLPFATSETRGNLGRVNFAKAYGTVTKDRGNNIGQ